MTDRKKVELRECVMCETYRPISDFPLVTRRRKDGSRGGKRCKVCYPMWTKSPIYRRVYR